MTEKPSAGSAGPATDRHNEPVIDPTANVLALVEAANKRQDDLRAAESRRVDEQAALRADHAKEVRRLEAERGEKIRQIDVQALQTLAQTARQDADNLRTALDNTARAIAKQTADAMMAIETRLVALERSRYEGEGRSKVADPAIEALSREVQSLRTAQSAYGGERRGVGQSWGVILGVVSLVATLLAIGGVVISASRGSAPPPAQPIYVPVPQGTLAPQAPGLTR